MKRNATEIIWQKLNDGEIFGKIMSHNLGGAMFWDVLSMSPDKRYIRWTHYGSSANKATRKDLDWVLGVIFHMTPAEFLAEYTTYSEFKRIDEMYREEKAV